MAPPSREPAARATSGATAWAGKFRAHASTRSCTDREYGGAAPARGGPSRHRRAAQLVSSTLRPASRANRRPRPRSARSSPATLKSWVSRRKCPASTAVVAHEAEQGRAIAAPVQQAQAIRFGAFNAQRPFDIVGHAPVDRIEDRERRVVQRIVEVEQPHRRGRRRGPAHFSRIRAAAAKRRPPAADFPGTGLQ